MAPKSTPTSVFVYGTLKPGEVNHARYCSGAVAQPAIAYGQLYALPAGYPAMTETVKGGPVYGYLLRFYDPARLKHLDALEDYHPKRPKEENEYYRRRRSIFTVAGEPIGSAWIYFMTPQRVHRMGGIALPQGRWTGG